MNKYNIKFNEIINLENLKTKFGIININADSDDLVTICKRLDLYKLEVCFIELQYEKVNSNDLIANYKFIAEGEQKCVITLKPVIFNIEKTFIITFNDYSTIELSTLESEFIEPVYNSKVNFSEIAIQMFSSFLDPYPKINNGKVDLEQFYKNKLQADKKKNNPFEVLNNLNK
jgi:uncharacterized metal-binding protein YceD (DUF177 family)